MPVENQFTAISLLDNILEFTERTPDPKTWTFEALKSNPPCYVRLQQIESLLKAFFKAESERGARLYGHENLRVAIESLLSGAFIRFRTKLDYERVIQFIEGRYRERYQKEERMDFHQLD